jgi:hypothetical protein
MSAIALPISSEIEDVQGLSTALAGKASVAALGLKANTADLGTAAALNVGIAVGDVVQVEAGGTINEAILPALAIGDTFEVATTADLTGAGTVGAAKGDIGIVTTPPATYRLVGARTVLGNWKLLKTPTDVVQSWNGLAGTISATTSNLPEGSNLYYTNTRADARADTRIAAARGAVNGVASLDGDGLIPVGQIVLTAQTDFANHVNDVAAHGATASLVFGTIPIRDGNGTLFAAGIQNDGGNFDIWADGNVVIGSGNATIDASGQEFYAYYIEADTIVGTHSGDGSALTGITAAQVGALATNAAIYPKKAALFHDDMIVLTGAARLISYDSNSAYGQRTDQGGGGANGDSWTNGFVAEAGTYSIRFVFLMLTSNGKLDIYIDNVLKVSGVDFYGGTNQNQVVTTGTFTIATSGYHVLKGVVNGKNASSSGYRIPLTKYTLSQAAD